MGKDSIKNLVGQPIFKQIIKIIPKAKFDELVIKYGSDKYYNSFFSWEQLNKTVKWVKMVCLHLLLEKAQGIRSEAFCPVNSGSSFLQIAVLNAL